MGEEVSLSWWTTVSIMFGSDRRKMRQIQRLAREQEEHWEKYLKARKKLREITGIP